MSRRSAPKDPPPEPAAARLPVVTIANRQRAFRVDLPRIRRLVRNALPLCLEECGPMPSVLTELPEVSVSIISAAAMSRVHVDFLGLEGPTDVITFPYGEILVCAAIAEENAARYRHRLDEELALYVIHGLLHLHGYDDLDAATFRQMQKRQAKILKMARRAA
jgi:probable rRNA maturation factor